MFRQSFELNQNCPKYAEKIKDPYFAIVSQTFCYGASQIREREGIAYDPTFN